MWNVKKSILSLWKARKERLFEGQRKTLKESEKNLQSTARERKFLSSKPSKETDPEAEIYEAINRIEFQFGKETHTVGETKAEEEARRQTRENEQVPPPAPENSSFMDIPEGDGEFPFR